MTILYLNGHRAVLHEDSSFKLILDNPYFTKSSSYTHDIVLPLKGCKENIEIFGNIHVNHIRNNVGELNAILIVDCKCLLRGTAIIRSINDNEVKIQLISGNSEFNYFFKSDVYVDKLDLGKADELPDINNIILNVADFQRIEKWWGKYPARNYCFYPVYNKEKDLVLNRIVAVYNNNSLSQFKFRFSAKEMLYLVGSLSVQPFLCFLIKRIVEELGYKLAVNQIEDAWMRNIIVCNGIDSLYFADSLPHWTIVEFFEEIENLFGAVTIVNESTKEVSILLMKDYYKDVNPKTLDDIVDEWEVEIDPDNKSDVSNGNIGYALDSDFFKYRKIKNEIIDYAQEKVYATYELLKSDYDAMTTSEKSKTIFQWDNRQFIHFSANGTTSLKEVNGFRNLIRNPDSSKTDIELNIIPVDLSTAYGPVYNGNILVLEGQVAVLNVPGDKYVQKESLNIQGVIDGISNYSEDQAKSKMYIAISDGVYQRMVGRHNNADYEYAFPWPYIDGTDHLTSNQIDRENSLQLYPKSNLTSLGSTCFHNLPEIDTTKEYQFQFISNNLPDPKVPYLVKNKKYVALSFELSITNKGLDNMQLAKLYAADRQT